MIDCGSLELAQARVLARHGQRATELDWQRLESLRDFASLLDAARRTPLRRWLAGMTAPAAPHRIEALLRAQWRAAVDEVAGWMPLAWQGGLRWCAVLADLPVLQHLALGGPTLAWMRDDPDYRALADGAPGPGHEVLASSAYAALAPAWSDPESLGRAWHAEWLRRLPQPLPMGGDNLSRLVALLQDHAAHFVAATVAGQGWLQRRTLKERLVVLLRRASGDASLPFIHLALTALDLERLRSELLGRALFARLPLRRVA